ncbi:cytochrome c-type biogenesis protein CcmH [Jiella sp. KSK16Y-1]|uniref:Cytochrome c-type biogenesis protein n=2 Tax=Jiella mangrovi TaxID=2821407 RepID=A0ABS4BE06_9HYPH|nr:cytochrome c-type biogenesis protein [Jiella mangrovi]MBP0614752.1 cytochrome c-type biogenesis protein CcmH [Jiella mangrovi]
MFALFSATPQLTLVTPAYAVNPDEMLKDPALEARARRLSAGLRCLVCQNESIDDSNADLAKDLRLLVRERIKAGDTDDEVIDYLVSRYGEFVLLKPRLDWATLALWATPLVVLFCGIALAGITVAGRRKPKAPPELSDAEEAAIARITADHG